MTVIERRLELRPPYDGDALLAWLSARSVAGLDEVEGGAYRRGIRLPHTVGRLELRPAEAHVSMRLQVEDVRDLAVAVARTRALADLDVDPAAVLDVLGRDPWLAPLARARPGLRVPGTVDGFELACRAVIGQQVSVAGARTLLARLVAALGDRMPGADPAGVHSLFPTAAAVADADLAGLGLTGGRHRALRALAAAVAAGELDLDAAADRAETAGTLLRLPGIGPWTAAYVAMRALRDPDAFPATDLGLLRASAACGGPGTAGELLAHSPRWSPWRAYAAQHLWQHDSRAR